MSISYQYYTNTLFLSLDLIGTFAFAISGASAAQQRNLDLFGVIAVSFVVACGGGIIRDLCIGATPPVGLSDWKYLATSILAATLTLYAYPLVKRLRHPVLWFDAIGLGLFAVSGAHKALSYGHNAEVAILLGMISAVGGGAIRDVLLGRVPVILRKEIYASAALLGASIQVSLQLLDVAAQAAPWIGMMTCTGLRLLSIHKHWQLPTFGAHRTKDK